MTTIRLAAAMRMVLLVLLVSGMLVSADEEGGERVSCASCPVRHDPTWGEARTPSGFALSGVAHHDDPVGHATAAP